MIGTGIHRIRRLTRLPAAILQTALARWGRRFYWYLAIAVSLIAVLDLTQTRLVGGMEKSTFDFLMRHRVQYASPDKDILIVDIDDASLKEMAGKFGRWPWPRDVMGEMVNKLEQHGPKAIVFDILFSEPDRFNKEADGKFIAELKRHGNIFFPMVLLDDLDGSRLPPESIPGIRRVPGEVQEPGTVSVSLPFFAADIARGHIGTNNIVPDSDGVIRRFSLVQRRHGWEISSIPLQIARELGVTLPVENTFLINWRGPPYSFTTTSFSHLYGQPATGTNVHLHDDINGKIIIIGSTAASLFDVKASPMARVHPGVEMLATVIDNLKGGSYLRLEPAWVYAVTAVVFVWLLAFTFYFQSRTAVTDGVFVFLQFGFVAVSYLLLNLSNDYLDMTAPITFCVVYYTVARIYAHHLELIRTDRTGQLGTLKTGTQYELTVLAASFGCANKRDKRRASQLVERLIASSSAGAARIENIFSNSVLLGDLYDDVIVLYWVTPEEEIALRAAVVEDIKRMLVALRAAPPSDLSGQFRTGLHSGTICWDSRPGSREKGRSIVNAAIATLDHAKEK